MLVRLSIPALALAAVTASASPAELSDAAPAPTAEDQQWRLPEPPMPADNAGTVARIDLGKALFFDPRMSGNGAISCATCHNPALGWSDGLKTAVGWGGKTLPRATPTVVNTAYNTQFMWDGRKKSLEDQALGPMQSPAEMNTDFTTSLARIKASPGYVEMFERAYPGEPIAPETIAKAIAAFERTVVSRDAPFDRWLAGDRHAITMAQWRGYRVFLDPAKGNCASCHSGANFTDNGYHNIGLAQGAEPDLGRFNILKLPSMKGAFKTPTLRDITLTAPYFHDGSAATLEAVVDHYAQPGGDPAALPAEMRAIHLGEQDKSDLVAFMRSLTGRPASVAVPHLPQ